MLLSKRLTFPITNNGVEYEACLFGLDALLKAGATHVEVNGNSALVIRQTVGDWEIKENSLRPYTKAVWQLASMFENCTFRHLPRDENQMADALAALSSLWEGPQANPVKPLMLQTASRPFHLSVEPPVVAQVV